ncbi:hypothetical protein QTJ16_003501 [Diplocarpon rosae]|uniref:Pectate lyase domain-containing protein n=1 Tax=Diplocarpon rosae TaxID=946125 RepID=A0AAD9T1B3_9HELO|nr:hypothetical protein QTJ16_003501 [Diplocarpon rosae]PBP21656.1 polysaccharide lyase family 1 protein [Diplocarpon rosae]
MCFLGLFSAAALLFDSITTAELISYKGPVPILPANRSPFSYGSLATGGASTNASSVFLVDNMPDLRAALTLPYPRTVYIKGNISGHEITSAANGSTYADCQWFIDNSGAKKFNFTRHLMSLNQTYMDGVAAESAKNGTIEGINAGEFLTLIKKSNGWRPQAQNSQKKWSSIDVKSDLTLIGLDESAYLNGVSLVFNAVNNVIIRNLKLTPPRDCFPSPDSTTSWNARYDALSLVTSTNFWIDGNTLLDGPAPVAPVPAIWDYAVDPYDGLMDCEDGTDNVTFSHNIVANHAKSILLGGGLKERDRSLGKLRFMLFGNWFQNSDSRNPMMRFGTFYIMNNLFMHAGESAEPYQRNLNYNLGVNTESNVLVGGNVFVNNAENGTKIFRFSNLSNATLPARLCIPAAETGLPEALQGLAVPGSSLNGLDVDLKQDGLAEFQRTVTGNSTGNLEGSLLVGCDGFAAQPVPTTFSTSEEVENYVRREAGQRTVATREAQLFAEF